MRVLVEQTAAIVAEAMDRVDVRWDGVGDHAGRVGVHLLMGGVDAGGDWNLFPECPAVLIGTQDMLLSRALMRGYASPRARWPLDFGLLSHDALWVMDEVQLMDVGLATSAQMQAYHDEDAPKGWRPRSTWWMSATLQPGWLDSVDTRASLPAWQASPCSIPLPELHGGPADATKSIEVFESKPTDTAGLARRVLEEHQRLGEGEFGRVTLVVCNTVARARALHEALRKAGRRDGLELVHSRFRPAERKAWRERFLSRAACTRGTDRIIVATQVVEAGVDISAGCLITELAPWSSLVQRFGRCARYGGAGRVVVTDLGEDEAVARPYAAEDLRAAAEALRELDDVGIPSLERFEAGLDEQGRARLYPYVPKALLLRREFEELFDTTPDLTGADLDVSRFIRSGEERDLQVFWLDVPKGEAPLADRLPRREELCAVPFLTAREWLCGRETKTARKPRLRQGVRAWVWDFLDGDWKQPDRAALTPGRVVCVDASVGGYRVEAGFDPESTEPVACVPAAELPDSTRSQELADEADESEALSAAEWKTLACHVGEVANLAREIANAVGLPEDHQRVLELAARWHDLGKAHPAFQGSISDSNTQGDRPDRQDLAKAPNDAWPRKGRYRVAAGDVRRGFRHELASALALFALLRRHAPDHAALLGPWREALALVDDGALKQPAATSTAPPTPTEKAVVDCSAEEFDLLAYLVASHHGKVRVALHASPADQEYRARDDRGLPIRGVREGDVLPETVLEVGKPALPRLELSLAPAAIGLSADTGRSWRERTLGLVERIGPGALAWLEALLIAADRRASRLPTADPALTPGRQS